MTHDQMCLYATTFTENESPDVCYRDGSSCEVFECSLIAKVRADDIDLLEAAWAEASEQMNPLDPHTYKVLRNALTGDTHA